MRSWKRKQGRGKRFYVEVREGKDSRGSWFKDSSGRKEEKFLKVLRNYSDLKVWQKAYQLCLNVYKLTTDFPNEEKYGLTSQIRRAAVSIPSNIAEGYGRKTTPEYIQFLYIVYGSNCELETQILLSGDLGFIRPEQLEGIQEDIREVERMLKALIKSLEAKK